MVKLFKKNKEYSVGKYFRTKEDKTQLTIPVLNHKIKQEKVLVHHFPNQHNARQKYQDVLLLTIIQD